MINTIADFAVSLWRTGRKVKETQGGWLSGNAVCCPHNGQTVDKRGRGGLIINPGGDVSWHCFNCGFKASYQPGRHLTYKFRKLLSWMGASDNDVKRLVVEAIRTKDLVGDVEHTAKPEAEIDFAPRELPPNSVSFAAMAEFYKLQDSIDYPESFLDVVGYVTTRNIEFSKYDFYWTDDTENKMDKRAIIPFLWKGNIVGYTARGIRPSVKPKYMASVDAGYVFNIDKQEKDWKFVIVSEGPFDAMSIDGVAVLHADVSEMQADVIDQLGREVIVVPDRDLTGKMLIDAALEFGWSVSFPIWAETCKDISEAVTKYGRLFVLKAILDAKESSKLKIELLRKKYYD